MKIRILGFIFIFCILFPSGCATEYNLATQQEETLLYGTEKEVQIGDAVSEEIEKQYEVVSEVEANERVERILNKVVEVCDRKDIVYFIKILDEDIPNAVSLPGGYVYIFKGLLDKLDNDDQLAGVIAHEVGHITAKHSIKKLQASYGAMILQILSSRANSQVAGGTNFALTSLFLEHSQQDEFEADKLAVKYMREAGFAPSAMLGVLEKLEEAQSKEPVRPYSYWRTHPHIPERMAVVNQAITGKIEFKDYLKLIGRE